MRRAQVSPDRNPSHVRVIILEGDDGVDDGEEEEEEEKRKRNLGLVVSEIRRRWCLPVGCLVSLTAVTPSRFLFRSDVEERRAADALSRARRSLSSLCEEMRRLGLLVEDRARLTVETDRLLGEGSRASVFSGLLGAERVAVKVAAVGRHMDEEAIDAAVERIGREARAHAAVRSERTVARCLGVCLDWPEERHAPFAALALELLEEVPAGQPLGEDGLAQVAEGLARLHALGLAHGDINRANLLFRAQGPPSSWELVLTDLSEVRAATEQAIKEDLDKLKRLAVNDL